MAGENQKDWDFQGPPSAKGTVLLVSFARVTACIMGQKKVRDFHPGPFAIGSACWARTSDKVINSHLLYQLS